MTSCLGRVGIAQLLVRAGRYVAGGSSAGDSASYWALPAPARTYVAAIIAGGILVTAWFVPTRIADPLAFAALTALSCLTSTWKVILPLPLSSGCTLSVSYAADLMALMLIGPNEAMLVALAGAWTQCTFRVQRRYPPYRTAFSLAAEAITIQATGAVYAASAGTRARPAHDGPQGRGRRDHHVFPRQQRPLRHRHRAVRRASGSGGSGTTTSSGARRASWWPAPRARWRRWSSQRGHHWLAMMMLAPVYLTYRTYHVFLGRIDDQQRHMEETRRLHAEAVEALLQARRAEQALAAETERLTVTLRSIGDGVITTDLGGTVLLINNMAERLTGWTRRGGDRQADRLRVPQLRSADAATAAPASSPRSWRTPGAAPVARCTVLAARDLSERPIEEIAAPLRDAAGRPIGMVVAFRDISDALKAQEERARAGKLASLGLLAGGIAHDFNNILMAIMGNVSMARVVDAADRRSGDWRSPRPSRPACARGS